MSRAGGCPVLSVAAPASARLPPTAGRASAADPGGLTMLESAAPSGSTALAEAVVMMSRRRVVNVR